MREDDDFATDDDDFDATSKQEKMKFYCAGADFDPPRCKHKAVRRWPMACPGCGHLYDILKIKAKKNAETRVTAGKATMDAVEDMVYYSTGIEGLDRVLGGGLVYEKLMMLGALKNCGKTIMLLQACDGFARGGRKAYFASGEMTQSSVLQYMKRIGIENDHVGIFGDPQGIHLDNLFEDVLAFGAKFLVIDSLPVCYVEGIKGELGQPTMMDAAINSLSVFAQSHKRAVFLIHHFNSEMRFAGSEKVHHLVDGMIRMDYCLSDGKPVDGGENLREIFVEKSRQGSTKIRAYVELVEDGDVEGRTPGIRKPSLRALRAHSKLHAV